MSLSSGPFYRHQIRSSRSNFDVFYSSNRCSLSDGSRIGSSDPSPPDIYIYIYICLPIVWFTADRPSPKRVLFPRVVGRYADADGNVLAASDSYGEYPSVAACTYRGVDGEEEMFLFFALAWFDEGSLAWAHYIAEWGTKGIFAVSARDRPVFHLHTADTRRDARLHRTVAAPP